MCSPLHEYAARRLPASVLLLLSLLLCRFAVAGTETVVYDFQMHALGQFPSGSLISDSKGNLYGVTANGGAYDCGVVYMLSPGGAGWVETVLYSFQGTTAGQSDGCSPNGALITDSAGNFYGATTWGGAAGVGTVFKLAKSLGSTWTEQILWSFQQSNPHDGFNPQGGLAFDKGGRLYGTTRYGGGYSRVDCSFDGGCGIVFRLSPQATGEWKEALLYVFQGDQDSAYPNGSLILDASGNLYGTSSGLGTSSSDGTVFELKPSGQLPWTLTTLHAFAGNDGKSPRAGLVFDNAGNLYGTTMSGGATQNGTVFQLTPSTGGTWTESVLHSFNGTDGDLPESELTFDGQGNLFGTTLFGGTGNGVAFELSPSSQGWTETVLWTFSGRSDGLYPQFALLRGAVGEFYGATNPQPGAYGNGTVFRLRNSGGAWHLATIASFADSDGGIPNTGLLADTQGNLYGTTSQGGKTGFGTVFELSPTAAGGWNKTELYNFNGVKSPINSYVNASALVFDASGNLYGETAYGGPKQKGTVFKLSRVGDTWVETDIFTFADASTGENPFGGLVFDAAGNLYGTTLRGGSAPACQNGCGAVFRLSPSSGDQWTETLLYQFQSGSDGSFPMAGLVWDPAGNLFGTTQSGGTQTWPCQSGCGTVFELSPAASGWSERIVYRFMQLHGDGSFPVAGLVTDSSGNLFGTTSRGGDSSSGICGFTGCGTVFELSPSGSLWTETIIHTFESSDGASPLGTPVLDGNGNLFGTTEGTNGGTVFRLSPSAQEPWAHTVLYQFPAPVSGDGYFPEAGVILDHSGNLLGTTGGGGQANSGRVFRITP